jgi:hypothetical protein
MITWAGDHMDGTIGTEFIKLLKYMLLANYLTTNKYDIKLFQEYIKKPCENHSELNEKSSKA